MFSVIETMFNKALTAIRNLNREIPAYAPSKSGRFRLAIPSPRTLARESAYEPVRMNRRLNEVYRGK